MGLNSKGKPCDLDTFQRPMRTAEPTIGVNPDPTAYHSFFYIYPASVNQFRRIFLLFDDIGINLQITEKIIIY